MASLFSVSRLIGRPTSKRTSSENEADSFSYPPTPCCNSKTQETLEEAGYDLVLQIPDKASFGEWTDTGEEKGESAEKADYVQFGSGENAQEERHLSGDTNWTPFDISKKAEESPLIPSVPDWTDLEFDREIMSEHRLKEERVARLEEMNIVKEEKGKLAERVKELEEELVEAVNELNMKMDQISKLSIDHDQTEMEIEAAREMAESLLAKQDSMEKRFNMMIGELSESQARVAELKSAGEVQTRTLMETNVIVASYSHTIAILTGEKADLSTQIHELEINKDNERQDVQKELDMKIEEISKLQVRVAELESAGDLQAKKLVEKEVILDKHSDTITVLEQQKANLIAAVQELKVESQARAAELPAKSAKKVLERDSILASRSNQLEVLKGPIATLIAEVKELRAIAKVNERQNSILLVQLGQKSDDDVIVYQGTVAKPVRRITGPTLVEHAVRTVKALNDNMYRFAASLTDWVGEIEKQFVEESDDHGTAAALETLKSFLGTKSLYTQLEDESRVTKDEYNPFIIQTGFQACLMACCMHIITLWDPAEPEYGKFLEVVYKKIRGLGEGENAAQWREWILQSYPFSTKTGRSVLSSFIVANLYGMLSMAGWPKSGETAKLLDKFSGNISEIVNLAVRLNELAAETAIPGDFQATTIEEGVNYASEGMTIDSPEGELDIDTPTPYSRVVVACVGFGLKWRQGDMYEALVLKPRVIVRKVYKPYST